MAQNMVSFIKEQLKEGRDPRTIREYLINKKVDKNVVDASFDQIFGPKKNPRTPIEKFIISSVAIFVLILVILSFSLYQNINSAITISSSDVNAPTGPTNIEHQLQIERMTAENVCDDMEDSEEKYQCYISLFETDDMKCADIVDISEKDFCYRSKDFYVLSI